MPDKEGKNKKVVGYALDLQAGYHRYVTVEGMGEYRENFARLVSDVESKDIDGIVVSKSQYLFVDTSPMWMEKFITL